MKTHIEINQIIERIDNIDLPESVSSFCSFEADQGLTLDILPKHCLSFTDECQRDNEIDQIIKEIKSMPEIESIEWDEIWNSKDNIQGRSYSIKLK